MGHLYDLADSFTPRNFCRAVPGPVRQLQARSSFRGTLTLQWRPPAGGGAERYRVERTRDGRVYETLAELTGEWCCLKNAPGREPWFYRVTAVNARGAGRAKRVWFFQRAGNGQSRLLPVPVHANLQVNICELSRE
jgi:hypothetical protein